MYTSAGIPRPDLPAQKLLEKWEADKAKEPNLTHLDHAIRLGIPYEIYHGRIAVGQAERERKLKPGLWDFTLPGNPWTLEGDWMITGDVHIPFTDIEFAMLISKIAKKHLKKPRRLLVGGDFFNMDNFSSYVQITKTPDWETEREAAKELLKLWLETFDEIKLILGNHDRRLQKFVAGAFDENDLMALVISNPDKVQMSGYGYCVIKSDNGPYRVTHPKNYSINQLNVADTLAAKFRQHIISFHEHHAGIGYDRYKHNLLVNGGTLCDPKKLAYVTLDDSKAAGMMNAFVMLRAGVPYLFGKSPLTDWRYWI